MTRSGQEQTKLWTLDTPWGVVDLLRARYVTQNFSRHWHRRYCVGVIEAGAMGFSYRGRGHVAPAGTVNLCIPGEIHNGRAVGETGWTYRMFYLPREMMVRLGGTASQAVGGPVFNAGVIEDLDLVSRLRSLHLDLEQGGLSALEAQERLLSVLELWTRRHADEAELPGPAPDRPEAARRARDYLAANLTEDVSLQELSLAAGLSPFHLSRIFRQVFGLPPHAWLNQARVRRARQLLESGASPAQAAFEVGYCDQSHLNRRFKAVYGVTPGAISKIVQDWTG